MALILLQWVGCFLAVGGSLLLALNNRLSGWGFVLFLLSNFCWLAFGFMTQAPGLVTMQVLFIAVNLVGVYRWFRPVPHSIT